MPRIKTTRRLRRIAMLEMLPFFLLILAAFWWEEHLPEVIRRPAIYIFLSLVFLLMAYIALRRTRRFVCPDCQTKIANFMPTHGVPGTPIRYHCKQCDVIWETGLDTLDD